MVGSLLTDVPPCASMTATGVKSHGGVACRRRPRTEEQHVLVPAAIPMAAPCGAAVIVVVT